MSNTIEIQTKDNETVIVVDCNDLPQPKDLIMLLEHQNLPLSTWIALSMKYKIQNKYDSMIELLEVAIKNASTNYDGHEKDRKKVFLLLGEYFLNKSFNAGSVEDQGELLTKSKAHYNAANLVQPNQSSDFDLDTSTTSTEFVLDLLLKAFTPNNTNPTILNYLANHYFLEKDYSRCLKLGMMALENSKTDLIKCESLYQIARVFHVQRDFDQAFQFYVRATDCAPVPFVLPYYGLAQMYLRNDDIENAIKNLEHFLQYQPENHEAMKILGLLYARSKIQEKQCIAKKYLKQVLEQEPDDLETRIELAHMLEKNDTDESLKVYGEIKCLIGDTVSPEMLNNVAALLNNKIAELEHVRYILERSLKKSLKLAKSDPTYYGSLALTTSYNLGRIAERQNKLLDADKIYNKIIKKYPNYIDCYLRKGCIAQKRNKIYEAVEWFKKALLIDCQNADTWLLLSKLNLEKIKLGTTKQIKCLLNDPQLLNDSLTLNSVGNIWLNTLYFSNIKKKEITRNLDLAHKFFTKSLSKDPDNSLALVGIACVKAHRHQEKDARKMFRQIEDRPDISFDVSLNIALSYIAQKQYAHAIQMFEDGKHNFNRSHNLEVHQYFGYAYFKTRDFKKAEMEYFYARILDTENITSKYNLRAVQYNGILDQIQNIKSTLLNNSKTVDSLKSLLRDFKCLSVHHDAKKYGIKIVATETIAKCESVLKQFIASQKLTTQKASYKRITHSEKEQNGLKTKHNENENRTNSIGNVAEGAQENESSGSIIEELCLNEDDSDNKLKKKQVSECSSEESETDSVSNIVPKEHVMMVTLSKNDAEKKLMPHAKTLISKSPLESSIFEERKEFTRNSRTHSCSVESNHQESIPTQSTTAPTKSGVSAAYEDLVTHANKYEDHSLSPSVSDGQIRSTPPNISSPNRTRSRSNSNASAITTAPTKYAMSEAFEDLETDISSSQSSKLNLHSNRPLSLGKHVKKRSLPNDLDSDNQTSSCAVPDILSIEPPKKYRAVLKKPEVENVSNSTI